MAGTSATETGTAKWEMDPAHSSVEFSVKHMMMTTVRGRFKKVQATLRGDRDHPEAAAAEPTIDVATTTTGVADRDEHLRGEAFSDVERSLPTTSATNRFL